MRSSRLQSAMEYLMTYGWAILIIAVVLGALFGLGFFNSANLAPKIGPGACQVYRPNGPGTASFINLEGACNNELPQYVAQFNGQSSSIQPETSGFPIGNNVFSIFAWVYATNTANSPAIYNYGTTGTNNNLGLVISSANTLSIGGGQSYTGSLILSQNSWHFVGMVYSAGASDTVTFYVDGQTPQSHNLGTAFTLVNNFAEIGRLLNGQSYFSGSIVNLQVYNASFSANEVTALYDEGIGGVPVLPQSLIGWWPLNGNANDYSGNLNNGIPTNVVYTSSWTSGYTAP